MINRYEGNTGRMVRLAEADDRRPPPPFPPPAPPRFPPPGRPPAPDPLSRLFSGLGELESERPSSLPHPLQTVSEDLHISEHPDDRAVFFFI